MNKWVKIALWSIFLIGLIFVGVIINRKIQDQVVPVPEVIVEVDGENAFISDTMFIERLNHEQLIFDGQKRSELNIEAVELFIQGISQVKSAEVYQRIDGNWKIDVKMRKPIARIYNFFGETYYLDDEGNAFDTSPDHTARVLVFSGDIYDRINTISVPEIINNDSLISIRKLDDIYRISDYVCNDPLFHSLIGQVHLKKNGDFILVPLVGDQLIVLGSAYSKKEVEEKFEKLRIFYEEAIPYEGWDTYSEISLKYDDQIVCKKKKTDE